MVKGKVLSYGVNQQPSVATYSNITGLNLNLAKGLVQQPVGAANLSLTIKSPRSIAAAAASSSGLPYPDSGSPPLNNKRQSVLSNQEVATASTIVSPIMTAASYLPPRYDLAPIFQTSGVPGTVNSVGAIQSVPDDIGVPSDGIIFARIRGSSS